MLNRRRAIIWTNADPIHWRTYVALGGYELIIRLDQGRFQYIVIDKCIWPFMCVVNVQIHFFHSLPAGGLATYILHLFVWHIPVYQCFDHILVQVTPFKMVD